MKAEFTLSIDDDGKPQIEFKHHERDDSIEQKLLAVFVKNAKLNGMSLKNPTGCVEAGTDNCWEKYVIKTTLK